ncbi:MAG: hypothetical protein ABFE01_04520 [Phycisphaerales bacterium]
MGTQNKKAMRTSPWNWTDAGHLVARAAEAVNWDVSDVDGFAKRVQSIDYGLSAETEFSAILAWLGRCSLVHRLDQECFSSHRSDNWKIPDLVSIFDHAGVRLTALIEVKTTARERLRFATSYLSSMQRYASAMRTPLLIAWKPRRLGFWLLVDPAHAASDGEKLTLSIETAMKNNLFSAVAGDFLVELEPNAGLFIDANVIETTRRTKTGSEVRAQVTNAEFRDANGNSARNVPGALVALILSRMKMVDHVAEDRLTKSFVTTDEPVFAQQVLRTAVALRHGAAGPIRWRHVARDMESYLSYEDLNDAITERFGTFVRYQFFLQPQMWPDFVPAAWRSVSRGAN